ncbi:hypothetical protein [Pseudomonas fluorescens]|uniref:Uncharacterized protein n=1 Tax=Pseudomonas fluorescens TaxID=294 RepID=A0A423LCV8_PSEFL|nr:hypothetical protein [Pseudomonas fluorescens]RON66138.1 hypothetical protein BK671_16650 [Pseudomonas fluorescens]
MNNNINLAKFGLDEKRQLLRTPDEKNTQESYFKAVFTPSPPPFDKYDATRFKYESFTVDTVTFYAFDVSEHEIMGISFNMPRYLTSGTYAIKKDDTSVGVMLDAGGLWQRGHEGSITFTRDAQKGSIEGTFHFKVIYKGSEYEVAGEFYLVKTGDL